MKGIMIGAGSRGNFVYGAYAQKFPYDLEFVAVVEINEEKRTAFAALHHIAQERIFSSWEDMLRAQIDADAVFICTLDRMHYEPAMAALEAGYHVMLEKPMAVLAEQCISLEEASRKHNRLLMISHILRYTPFWSEIKAVLENGIIGEVVTLQLTENVGYHHMAHSYVRGNWRNSKESSPMILAKSSHDLDIISWLIDDNCTRVSSFGSLSHFHKGNAPQGSTLRCSDGCKVERECPYSALKIYHPSFPVNYLRYAAPSGTSEEIQKNVDEGPFGRCVYHCDNDVVDNQIVNLQFENGATASLTMSGFTNEITRSIKIMGTHGEIKGDMESGKFSVQPFGGNGKIEYHQSQAGDGHGGGDERFVRAFVRSVHSFGENSTNIKTSAAASLQSHLMAFAAESSRLNQGHPIEL